MNKELTDKQIEQQDIVDNAIFSLVNSLIPTDDNQQLDWDIEWISGLRENIQDIIYEKGKFSAFCTRDEFEMKFYPYIEL